MNRQLHRARMDVLVPGDAVTDAVGVLEGQVHLKLPIYEYLSGLVGGQFIVAGRDAAWTLRLRRVQGQQPRQQI
jgi:hypothetical protein